MLTIRIPSSELYNEKTNEFVYTSETTLTFEHSLYTISKWESIWKKPWFDKEEKTEDEMISYYKCMVVSGLFDDQTFKNLPYPVQRTIGNYINEEQTATVITNHKNNKFNSSEIITTELIYFWMVSFGIPFECQHWHLSRLLMLIQVCGIKNQPVKNRSKRDILNQNAAINKARRARMHTRG